MQIIIFLIEILVVFYFVEMDKIDGILKTTKQESLYVCNISINENGEELLILNGVSENKKILMWQNSPIKKEIIEYFPNMQKIYNEIENRVVDDGEFKERLLEYIDYIQGEFLSGNITQQELKKSLLELKPLQPKEKQTLSLL